MKKGKRKFWIIFIVVLIILVLLAGGYFGVKAYSNWRANRNIIIFQQGIQLGYAQAVWEIINVSDNCQPFPVYVGNETRELISVTCFR